MIDKVKENVISVIKTCYDPEIPIDLWNLGLIYNINVTHKDKGFQVDITMSLTTPGCTMGTHMSNDIIDKVSSLKEIEEVKVNVTFDPPWAPEMMTPEARKKLGYESVKKNEENKSKVEWE